MNFKTKSSFSFSKDLTKPLELNIQYVELQRQTVNGFIDMKEVKILGLIVINNENMVSNL